MLPFRGIAKCCCFLAKRMVAFPSQRLINFWQTPPAKNWFLLQKFTDHSDTMFFGSFYFTPQRMWDTFIMRPQRKYYFGCKCSLVRSETMRFLGWWKGHTFDVCLQGTWWKWVTVLLLRSEMVYGHEVQSRTCRILAHPEDFERIRDNHWGSFRILANLTESYRIQENRRKSKWLPRDS